MELGKKLQSGRRLRVIGFDDAPKEAADCDNKVSMTGVVCINTRFEGMVLGKVTLDGGDATEELARLVRSKFHGLIDAILLDGLTMAGRNVVNLLSLSEQTGLPTVAVMRRAPDLPAFKHVILNGEDGDKRWQDVVQAGPIHELGEFVFNVSGEDPLVISKMLGRLTDCGKVPEPLRLAHLIAGAIAFGVSGNRA